jgi:HEAT repeat protein
VLAGAVAASMICVGAPSARAQEATVVRYTAPAPGAPEPWNVVLKRRTRRETVEWVATLERRGRRTREMATVQIAEWTQLDFYDYDVALHALDARHYFVVLTGTPNPEKDAPKFATRFQLAWLVDREGGKWRGRFVTKAEYNELDGGAQLFFVPGKRYGVLKRRRPLPGMQFCGRSTGEDAELERFDLKRDAFVVERDVDALIAGSRKAQAYLPQRAFSPSLLSSYYLWFSATTDIRNPPETVTTVIRPLELGDQSLDTLWSEGSKGLGRGEFVTARVDDSLPMRGLRLFPGNGADQRAFDNSPKPRRVLVGLSDGSSFDVSIPARSYKELVAKGGLYIELPTPMKTSCVSVMILEGEAPTARPPRRADYGTQRGFSMAQREYTSTGFAEITPVSLLYGLEPRAAARVILEQIRQEDDPKQRSALALLARPYSEALIDTLRIQSRSEEGITRPERVVPLLAVLPSEQAIPLLVDLLRQAEPATTEYRSIKRAMAAHRAQAAEPLTRIIRQTEPVEGSRYVDMVRLLGRVAEPEQLQFLLDDLGEGDTASRNERIRALAGTGDFLLSDLIAAAAREPGSAATIDALKTLGTIGRHTLERVPLSPTDSERLLATVRDAQTRREMMRALRAVHWFQPAGGVEMLAGEIYAAKDPLLRAAAVEAAGAYPSTASRELLELALSDTSPDVRIAAVRALTEHPERDASQVAILAYIQRERWRAGLEPALIFLANLKDDQVLERITRLVGDTARKERAYLVARALERARVGISAELARPLLFDQLTELRMRRQLIELLGYTREPAAAELLLELVRDRSLDPFEEARRADDLHREAMMSLGRHQTVQGKALLLRIAREDERGIKARKAALRALSFYEDEALRDELETWALGAEPDIREWVVEAQTSIQRRIDLRRTAEDLKEQDPFKDIVD